MIMMDVGVYINVNKMFYGNYMSYTLYIGNSIAVWIEINGESFILQAVPSDLVSAPRRSP